MKNKYESFSKIKFKVFEIYELSFPIGGRFLNLSLSRT